MGDLSLQVPGSKAPTPTHGMAWRGVIPWSRGSFCVVSGTGKPGAAPAAQGSVQINPCFILQDLEVMPESKLGLDVVSSSPHLVTLLLGPWEHSLCWPLPCPSTGLEPCMQPLRLTQEHQRFAEGVQGSGEKQNRAPGVFGPGLSSSATREVPLLLPVPTAEHPWAGDRPQLTQPNLMRATGLTLASKTSFGSPQSNLLLGGSHAACSCPAPALCSTPRAGLGHPHLGRAWWSAAPGTPAS